MNIYGVWEKFSKLPAGRFLFSRFLARYVPYTGSVKPEVIELRPGFARVRLKDRPAIRNHLKSIHAAALMNFAEATSGLAFMAGLPKGMRAILTGFEIEYLKKARGTLEGVCEAPTLTTDEAKELQVVAELKNEQGEVVARAKARWLAGPDKKRS